LRTLNRHIAASFLTTLLVSLAVLTFVLSLGVVFKMTELLARGAPWRPIVSLFLLGMPAALSFAIPISALTSTLLVFGRWSADGEIAAMKACGISLWQVAARPLQISVALTALCFAINDRWAPRSHMAQRQAINRLGAESALDLLEEGRFIRDFENLTIYIGARRGAHLENVRIYDLRKPGLRREIRAMAGTVTAPPGSTNVLLELRDVRVDPFLDDRPGAAFSGRWTLSLPATLGGHYSKKDADFTGAELLAGIRRPAEFYGELSVEDLARQRMRLIVEYNKRLVLAVACSAFVLLGIPLGIKSHRKESSVGIALSLLLVSGFYLFIILAETLDKRPELRPYLLVWAPVLLAAALGAHLIRRSN